MIQEIVLIVAVVCIMISSAINLLWLRDMVRFGKLLQSMITEARNLGLRVPEE